MNYNRKESHKADCRNLLEPVKFILFCYPDTKTHHLWNEIGSRQSLIEQIKQIINTDIIIFSLPIYENSVPGLILEFFELLYQYKDKLSDKPRKMLVISNSGFSEPEANRCAIDCCRLFAREMGFSWMGGFGVPPGTLINGRKLEEEGGTYKKLINLLSIMTY